MIALVGAMFTSLGSVGAQAAASPVGTVDANKGYCIVATGINHDNDTDTALTTVTFLAADPVDSPGQADYDSRIMVVKSHDANGNAVKGDFPTPGCGLDSDSDPNTDSTLDADDVVDNDKDTAANRNRPFSITPNGTDKPLVVRLTPTATIAFTSDSDDIVAAGKDVTASVTFSNLEGYGNATGANNTPAEVVVTRAQVSGELDNPALTAENMTAAFTDGKATATFAIENPKGTTKQSYTFSVTAHFLVPDANTDDSEEDDQDTSGENEATSDRHVLTPSDSFTVGDPGTNTAGLMLELGNKVPANGLTGASEVAETGSAPVGDTIILKLTATNSLGNPSNGDELTGLTVLGVGGHITLVQSSAGEPGGNHLGDDAMGDTSASINTGIQAVTFVKVKKAGGPSATPGTVDVWAQLVGKDGAARAETLSVSFTGTAKSLVLGTAPAVSRGNMKEFTISAEDAGGNSATVDSTKLTFSVVGPDGKAKGTSVLKIEPSTQGKYTEDTEADDSSSQVTGLVTAGAKAPVGDYTVTVSLVGVKDSAAETTVTVSGGAAEVSLDVDNLTPATDEGFVTATATVSDREGNPVADKTSVQFNASGDGKILQEIEPADGHETTDGVATARFVVIGSGTSKISVVAGEGLAVATVVVGGGAEAMPEEEVSVSCLHNLAGFTSWTCDVESSASEIFGLVSGRGVTALHLWNGTAWVRYSVVDGTMVPGSSDFMVTKSDILYISN